MVDIQRQRQRRTRALPGHSVNDRSSNEERAGEEECWDGTARWTNQACRRDVRGRREQTIRRCGDLLDVERSKQGLAGDRVDVVHAKRCNRSTAAAVHLPFVAAAASGALFCAAQKVRGNGLPAAEMRCDGHPDRDHDVQQKEGDMTYCSHASIWYGKCEVPSRPTPRWSRIVREGTVRPAGGWGHAPPPPLRP